MRTTVKKKRPGPEPPMTEALVRRQLARASGSDFFQYRDPVYHVSESFQQTFDRIGQSHARKMTGASEERSFLKPEGAEPDDRKSSVSAQPEKDRLHNYPNTGVLLQQFSETAFQRGSLSASILAGTGKMMLVSCLKRTIGQSGPKRLQQQSLFDTGSQTRNIPNRDPDQMIFNRTFANGAVGLVVDTLRDTRRVVQSMEDMARGTGELKGSDSSTLRMMYPFLDDSQEQYLTAQYEAQLAQTEDGREQAVLQNALVHTRALWNKKKQMKIEFINKLRQISERATEALEEFNAPGYVDELLAALTTPEEAPPPMEEPPPDTGEDHDPDRPEDQQPEDFFGPEQPSGAGPEEAGP